MPGSADDGGEDSPGGIVSGEASLAHTAAIVHNQRRYIIVTHLVVWGLPCLLSLKPEHIGNAQINKQCVCFF